MPQHAAPQTPQRTPTAVSVRVPATSANLGPGFDSLGLALDWTATVTLATDGGAAADPAAAERPEPRMALAAARTLFQQAGADPEPLHATVTSDIPVGRGLGVSALARVGGLVAANRLLGDPLDTAALLSLATRLERHADNAAPALLGGLRVVVEADDAVHELGIAPPPDLQLAMLIPEFSMPTEESRQRLPDRLTRNQSVHNIGRAALLVGALVERRYDLLRVACEDVLHQPARATLFPAMYPVFQAARDAGAHGVYLSGGGSTIAAFVTAAGTAVLGAMREAAAAHGVAAAGRVVALAAAGAQIVDAPAPHAGTTGTGTR